jgi:hypothetical protein
VLVVVVPIDPQSARAAPTNLVLVCAVWTPKAKYFQYPDETIVWLEPYSSYAPVLARRRCSAGTPMGCRRRHEVSACSFLGDATLALAYEKVVVLELALSCKWQRHRRGDAGADRKDWLRGLRTSPPRPILQVLGTVHYLQPLPAGYCTRCMNMHRSANPDIKIF